MTDIRDLEPTVFPEGIEDVLRKDTPFYAMIPQRLDTVYTMILYQFGDYMEMITVCIKYCDYTETIPRKKKLYDNNNIKQFLRKANLPMKIMIKEFFKIMRKFDDENCECDYDQCLAHSLEVVWSETQ
jgi:hypothetical protein